MSTPEHNGDIPSGKASTGTGRRSIWSGPGAALMIILLLSVGVWTVYREKRELCNQFLAEARAIAQAFDRQTIALLSDGDANQAADAYQKLKTQLTEIQRATTHHHTVYILNRQVDGSITVLADSEPPTSGHYTPPGQRFTGLPPEADKGFSGYGGTIIGPYLCQEHRHISAVVPVTESRTGRGSTAVMLSITTGAWYRELALEALESWSLILVLLVPLGVYLYQRRKIEQALIASELEWHNTFDSMPDLIAVLDTEHRIIKANHAMREIMCRDEQGAIAHHCYRHMHNMDMPPEYCPHSQLLKDGKSHNIETYLPLLQGEYAVSVTPLHDSAGRVTGSIHFAHDISHQKRAEESLRKSEEQHRNLFEKSSDAIFVAMADGAILMANPAACRMFGMSDSEIRLVGLNRIIDHADPRYRQAFEIRSKCGEFSGELNFVRNNGEVFPADVYSNIFTDSTGNERSMVRIRDISEYKRLERNLQESEERYRTLFNEVRIGIAMADAATGIIIDCNQGLADIVDRPIQELIGSHQSLLHPPEAFDGEFTESFARHRLNIDGELLTDRLLTAEGNLREVEIKARKFLYRGREVILGSFNDITDRISIEHELNRKNAEIEQFIYTVSHDLRSPLVTVKTFLGFLDEDHRTQDLERTAKDMEYLHAAADRLEALLNELLDMSRVGRTGNPHENVTYRELLVEALDGVAGQVTVGNVDIRLIDADLPMRGDRQRLVQIWQNLLDNALKYMGGQQQPHIAIGTSHADGETVFYVCDNGIGVAPEYHEKIFGIFEQLNRDHGGVGMGLTMVRRIVELYGGRIWVESEGEGHGCCFRFTLPKAIKEQEP